jgi:4-amino-4-deoxy-L-arabinose transferase-like glycosyltransferase
LFFGGLLLLLLIVTRWTWIDCDGGTPSLNEYGYFATDEGYYCGGGRQKFLRDRFISTTRAVPCTYAICPSTHVMTWWAMCIFGQTTWTHRVFPFLIGTVAWLTAFCYFSRKTLAWIAFLLCAVCVTNPLLAVYSRTSCNDSLMGALLLIGYVLTRKKDRLNPVAGGFVFGLGLWVKMSIWALVPIGLSAAAMSYSVRNRWRRIASFLAGFGVSACIQYGLIRLMIYRDAVSQDISVEGLLRASNAAPPLPDLLDWSLLFRGLSSFPRCPADGLLGLWTALFLALPCLLLLRRLAERPLRWDGRLILYFALPFYAAGIVVLPVFYTHYYIPVIMMVPFVWFEARHDLKQWAGGNPFVSAALLAGALLAVMWAYNAFAVSPENATSLSDYLSNAYNLPPKVVWTRNGWYLSSGAALLTLLAVWARQRKPNVWIIAGAFLSALGVADLCFSTIPLCEASKYTPVFSPLIRDVARVLQVCVILILFAVWGMPAFLRRSVRWYVFLLVLFGCGTFANPVWRNGAVELTRRGHLHKQAAAELARLLPDDAVVFGERAPQLLLSLKPRVSSAPNADPVPFVLSVHEKYPEWPLFALLDSEHNYHFTHYENNKDKIRMEVLHTLRLPSFNTGLPSDVFLVRLSVLDTPPLYGPRLSRE